MKVYLLNKETNEVIQEFSNVLTWNTNYVEYLNNGCRGKIYCDRETECFTDNEPSKEIEA